MIVARDRICARIDLKSTQARYNGVTATSRCRGSTERDDYGDERLRMYS